MFIGRKKGPSMLDPYQEKANCGPKAGVGWR
jgi:hypothetical protein